MKGRLIINRMQSSSGFCRSSGAITHKSGADSMSPRKYEENCKAINREPDNQDVSLTFYE